MNGAQYLRCSCCGQDMPDLPRLDSLVVALELIGDQKRLFTILSAARGRYLSIHELVLLLYFECEDGGPADAVGSITVIISKLRTKLRSYPVAIEEKFITGSPVRLVAARRWTISRPIGGHGYQLVQEAA